MGRSFLNQKLPVSIVAASYPFNNLLLFHLVQIILYTIYRPPQFQGQLLLSHLRLFIHKRKNGLIFVGKAEITGLGSLGSLGSYTIAPKRAFVIFTGQLMIITNAYGTKRSRRSYCPNTTV